MRGVESLLCAAVVLTIAGMSDGDLLFPSGTEAGPTCDDCFSKHTFTVPFLFYCKPYKHVFVNENGILSFDRDFWHFVPEKFPLTSETDPTRAVVSPFWTDHDIESGGNIWTRMADKGELTSLSDYIHYTFKGCHDNFVAVEALIATFEDVLPYCGEDFPGMKNTYQVVLITDGIDSYVMFNYAKLEWESGCKFEYAVAGLNSGDGKSTMLPSSGTEDAKKLALGTNVGMKGRYIFRVSGSTAIPSGCLQNDKCPIVTNFTCSCSSKTDVPPSLTSFDGLGLDITQDQKTVLSQWGNGTKNVCKFSIVARSFKTYQSTDVPLYVEWMAINIGVFPKAHRVDKFARSYKIKDGEVLTRGPNSKGLERPIVLPHNWVAEDEDVDITITKEGNIIHFRSSRCPYGLDVQQVGRTTKTYTVYAGDKYQDGQLDGMCGDCDGNKDNDMRKCAGLGPASGSGEVTKSCQKAGLQMVG